MVRNVVLQIVVFAVSFTAVSNSVLARSLASEGKVADAGQLIQFQDMGDVRLELLPELNSKGSSGFNVYYSKPWKNGVVPIKFKSTILKSNQEKFWTACRVWGQYAKVQCRPKSGTDKNYLLVTDNVKDRCWTDLGAGVNGGERVFNFSLDWCWRESALLHELGHVLGLMHEHQRPDRDFYLDVRAENAGEFAFTYEKLSIGELDKTGSYDFLSIMHYWHSAYSVNGQPILVPRSGYEHMAQRMGRVGTISLGDQEVIRKIYGEAN